MALAAVLAFTAEIGMEKLLLCWSTSSLTLRPQDAHNVGASFDADCCRVRDFIHLSTPAERCIVLANLGFYRGHEAVGSNVCAVDIWYPGRRTRTIDAASAEATERVANGHGDPHVGVFGREAVRFQVAVHSKGACISQLSGESSYPASQVHFRASVLD